MLLNFFKPKQALNKAFFKIKPNRAEMETFRSNLIKQIDLINKSESKEFHKNLIIYLLKKTNDPPHYISTLVLNALVIHNSRKAISAESVIIKNKKMDKIMIIKGIFPKIDILYLNQ